MPASADTGYGVVTPFAKFVFHMFLALNFFSPPKTMNLNLKTKGGADRAVGII